MERLGAFLPIGIFVPRATKKFETSIFLLLVRNLHGSTLMTAQTVSNSPSGLHPLGTRIARGASAAFGVNVLAYGFLFAGQIMIARLLTQADYAIFSVAVSFTAIMSLIADLGMNPLFTRLFAEAEEEVLAGKQDRRGLLLGSGLTLRVGLSVIVAVLVVCVAPALYPAPVSHMIFIMLPLLLISSRLLIVRSVGDSVLRALGKYYLFALFALLDAVVFAILIFAADFWKLKLDQVIWIYVLCNVPGFLLLVYTIIKWIRSEHITLKVTMPSLRSMLKLSIPLALGTAFLTIHTQIDNLLLYHLSTPVEVSNYSATIRLSAAMSPFSLVMAAVAAPELTRLLQRADFARARQLTGVALRLLLVAGVAIAVIFTFMANALVPLILGAKYSSASALFIWTGWMLAPIFIGTLLMDLSIASGDSWFMTANTAVGMVVVIVGDLFLIPRYGAMGAMASKLTAVTLGAMTILWLSRTLQHIDIRRFGWAIIGTATGALIAVGVAKSIPGSMADGILPAILALAIYSILIHFARVLPMKEVMELVKRIRLKPSTTVA